MATAPSHAFTLQVVSPSGAPITGGFRYLVEQDLTFAGSPGQPALPEKAISMSFHRSYLPVLKAGDSDAAGSNVAIPLPSGARYYVSVLPKEGFTIGGASVAQNQNAVTVVVNPLPIPTAQLSVLVFEDNAPINNAPDGEAEAGLAGFDVKLYEAGGRYGVSGGMVSVDAFGNPLGTTYDANGDVAQMGSGVLKTDGNGELLIKNLYPGKYTIFVIPPSGQGWVQTATIEGTKGIDAWVKPNEPAFFQEFGPPGYHVFVGFVKAFQDHAILTGGATLKGQIVNNHNSRPPDFTFYNGDPVAGAWVGLNDIASGRGIYAGAADPNTGEFMIQDVPPGTYELVVWDENLDMIFALYNVSVPEGAVEVNLLDVPVFSWFGRVAASIFYDTNENGFQEPGEDGISNMVVNLRFRDGTVYQSLVTEQGGEAMFQEVFPFFNWLVAEVDFGRFKATGATYVVDAGGQVLPDQGWDYPSLDLLNPQPQCDAVDPVTQECLGPRINPLTGNNLSRTVQGPELLAGIQTFLGQTNALWFGKSTYGPGENGGISGVVYYDTTRAEDDPRYNAPEPWQPGIPRVQVNLYEDSDRDGVIDDVNGDGDVTLSDVDNYPFNWRFDPEDPTRPLDKGPEDVDWNENGLFEGGDAISVVHTDSWDDNLPTDCQGEDFYAHGVATDCYDGLRNFNQIRPAVFDGGYAFTSFTPGGLDSGNDEISGLIPDMYIVEAAMPEGYEVVKEEDKNVVFGDTYSPTPALLPPACVGDAHVLPPELSLFPGEATAGYDAADPTRTTPLCNRRQVLLSSGQNAASDFFFFTYVPIAGHGVGFILNDLANEFDPTSPTFGEKHALPWLPISIQDFTGKEIGRTYTDEYGAYNFLVPSTYSINVPSPSGVAPAMLTACMNHPGPIVDNRVGSPTFGQYVEDPYFNRQFSQFCYTLQYMPGTTTYLDTPVVPVAAFAGINQFPLDCEYQDGTPVIYSVSNNGAGGGPWVATANGTQRLTIISAGQYEVANPAYDGPGGVEPSTILRDFSFGATPGRVLVNGRPLTIQAWTAGTITAIVPLGITTGELLVERGDGDHARSPMGVTLTVGGANPIRVAPGGSIQKAIDSAANNSLILVAPGDYKELVVMDRPLRLQGWGAFSTRINAAKTPTEKLTAWRARVQDAVNSGRVSLLPGQPNGGGGLEPALLGTEEGPGIVVLARNASAAQGGFGNAPRARIDGFTITGGDTGGGIFVNGYANFLQIMNTRIMSNQGFYHGGIRIGHPYLTNEVNGQPAYVNGNNDNIQIRYNQITRNGGLAGVGGGISIATGTDSYNISDNFICGNFMVGDGGGIGHYGFSQGGVIERNQILFNQTFDQTLPVTGGGLFIGGADALAGTTLSPGSGNATVQFNTFIGNLAGAGDGGAIELARVNGQDVAAARNVPATWYTIHLLNNVISNNVAGLAGGALSIQDALRVNLAQNTIVHNDSTATSGSAFTPGVPNTSVPQPAGIVVHASSTALYNAIGTVGAAAPYKRQAPNPTITDDIIFENRSFYFQADPVADPPTYVLYPDLSAGEAPVYWDLAVVGTSTPTRLDPRNCVLTDATGYHASNRGGNPLLVSTYVNGASNVVQQPEFTTSLQALPAFDEGGNFIDVRFGPLTLVDPSTGLPFLDAHLQPGSNAIDAGSNAVLLSYPALFNDIDGDLRPIDGDNDGTRVVDIGVDEY